MYYLTVFYTKVLNIYLFVSCSNFLVKILADKLSWKGGRLNWLKLMRCVFLFFGCSFNKGPGGARTLFKMDPRRDKMGQRTYHEVTGDNVCPSMIRGIDFIRDPRLNKVCAQLL